MQFITGLRITKPLESMGCDEREGTAELQLVLIEIYCNAFIPQTGHTINDRKSYYRVQRTHRELRGSVCSLKYNGFQNNGIRSKNQEVVAVLVQSEN